MTSGYFAGKSPTHIEVEVGQDVPMKCPSNTSNEDTRWWHGSDRLVLAGKVLDGLKYKDRLSFNNTTGVLTIHGAIVSDSGLYICGFAFDNNKYHINLTVKGKRSLVIFLINQIYSNLI